ncbi:MAG: creatininase family protein [Planctomycetota bacterium]|nr:creatininase family protein [Planctomycetota bacterium]
MSAWQRYETLRPDQLRAAVDEAPVLYWPLGLLEHHGWHLPVGFDGLKAERLCIRMAERTGGLLLPVMWWGAGGGHGEFAWTFYQDAEAAKKILRETLERAALQGFKALVVVAGHYPWQPLLNSVVPVVEHRHPDVLILAGNEMALGRALDVPVSGDHAARWETSYGLALLPEHVEMAALREGRTSADWPNPHKRPRPEDVPKLQLDPGHALFSQVGEDPRGTATAEAGEAALSALCDALAAKVAAKLKGA